MGEAAWGPEGHCERCGCEFVSTWHAPHDVWNAHAPSRESILCPNCFIALAGPDRIWAVLPDNPGLSPARVVEAARAWLTYWAGRGFNGFEEMSVMHRLAHALVGIEACPRRDDHLIDEYGTLASRAADIAGQCASSSEWIEAWRQTAPDNPRDGWTGEWLANALMNRYGLTVRFPLRDGVRVVEASRGAA